VILLIRSISPNSKVGWLESLSARPYAYKSVDGGATWQQVPLPSPRGGWPAAGQFFVAAQPTRGTGVIVAVASFAPPAGRSGIGATVASYPPLTVRAFDGGVPVSYVYVTFADSIATSSWTAVTPGTGALPPPRSRRQTRFSSLAGQRVHLEPDRAPREPGRSATPTPRTGVDRLRSLVDELRWRNDVDPVPQPRGAPAPAGIAPGPRPLKCVVRAPWPGPAPYSKTPTMAASTGT